MRSASDLDTLVLLSSSSRRALITLWTASWCSSCRAVAPLLRNLIEDERAGEHGEQSVNFAEVELDSPDVAGAGVASRYMITSVPFLVSFSRGEMQLDTRVTDVGKMKDARFLKEWIEREARRGGEGGAGGSLFGGWFGGK